MYFAARGGVSTFGYPASRPFMLFGSRVQLFQRYVMQQQPGRVGLLNVLDEDLMPYTDFGTAVIPPSDPRLAASAPSPDDPSYGPAAIRFLSQNVPNTWMGIPVNFLDAFLQVGRSGGDLDPAMQALVGVEVLGFPTSAPAPDARNTNFIYQRFQRAVLQYDASTGLTQPLLMADYLKAIITGQNLPPSLAMQAQSSRLYLQYRPGLPGWVSRPDDLPGTDMTLAFEPLIAMPEAAGQPPAAASGTPGLIAPTTGPATEASRAATTAATPAGAQTAVTTTPTLNPARPVIERVEPGGASAGQDVILRGHSFGDQPGQVLFTGKSVMASVWSDNSIIVTVPTEAVDGVIRIRRPDGVISAGVGFAPYTTPTGTATVNTATPTLSPTPTFTVTATPTRSAPSPPTPDAYYGPVGSSLLLQGSGFGTNAGQVIIGGQAAPVAQWSDSSIVVSIPSSLDSQAGKAQRVRIVRADGAVSGSVTCFIISPGTPTATAVPPAPPATATPGPPGGC
jgi:hypothetical protein